MLKLTRKRGESIQIDEVLVTVTRLSASRVVLGISAPDEVTILRSELVEDVPIDSSSGSGESSSRSETNQNDY